MWRSSVRQGVTIHHGSAMTVEDVAFSIMRAATHPRSEIRGRVGGIADRARIARLIGGRVLAEPRKEYITAGEALAADTRSLGLMISRNYEYLFSSSWWTSPLPGVALLLLVLSVNLFGAWLRDALDPRAMRAPLPCSLVYLSWWVLPGSWLGGTQAFPAGLREGPRLLASRGPA